MPTQVPRSYQLKGKNMARYRFLEFSFWRSGMRKCGFLIVLAVAVVCLVQSGLAQELAASGGAQASGNSISSPSSDKYYNPLPRHFPTKERFAHQFALGSGGNLSYHNGPVIPTANVVPIFWGPTWSTTGSADNHTATDLTNYIDGGTSTDVGFGITGEYNVITQYYETNPTTYINQSHLGAAGGALYDSSTPPTNVTDADIQAEVVNVVTKAGKTLRADTVYEVFLPSSSYSSDGNYTSCGGPNLTYCAYHGNFTSGGLNIKYGSMPYPSCSGCQTSGFTVTQNFQHFVSHETREAVTDPDGTAWYDRRGNEADDKCAWSPTPFTDSSTGVNSDGTGFAYQYEWSNATSSCVQKK